LAEARRVGNDMIVDVREDLRAGREPFGAIMAALNQLPPGGRMILYATFKPEPLISLLEDRGFNAEATELPGGEWRVVFSGEE